MSQRVKMFFQVIHPHTGKLEVPTKFVYLYGEKFLSSSSIVLMVPNGDTWPVHLQKNEESVMLGDGWTEFVRHYSISAMDIITFEYKCHRKSLPIFNVIILKDSTNSEISYPRKPSSSVNEEKHHNLHRSNRMPASFEKCQAVFKAGRCYMGVPLQFLQKARLLNEKTLRLKGQSGRVWDVKLKHRVVVCKLKSKDSEYTRYHLGQGWKDFRTANGIVVTDKLKFEHINGCLIAVSKVI